MVSQEIFSLFCAYLHNLGCLSNAVKFYNLLIFEVFFKNHQYDVVIFSKLREIYDHPKFYRPNQITH